jgi:tripartite-type tricarboxylate transporter receptor subunit TctC
MGMPGLYLSAWSGLWAPKGTPKEVVARLASATRAALADATVQARMKQLGQAAFPVAQQTPEALGAFHRAEVDKWFPIIKAAGVKVE